MPCPAIPPSRTNSPNSKWPPRPGRATSTGSSAAARRSGTRSSTIRDDQHGLFRHRQRPLLGAGSPQPGGGDNLFVSSIVALNADTGKYVWHYQETPGDEWDYDNCNPVMVADLPLKGGKKRVVMQASKNGFYYVLDAKTGKLLSADKYVPETNWATHVDMKTGRPVENPEARYSQTGKPVIICAGRARHAQLAPDGATARRPATSTSRSPSRTRLRRAGQLRLQSEGLEHRPRTSPAARRSTPSRRSAARQHRQLHPRLGSGEGERSLAHPERGAMAHRASSRRRAT